MCISVYNPIIMEFSNKFSENLSLTEFTYELPDGKIACYPLENRDASRLLIWKDGEMTESQYRQLPDLLPGGSLLVFNNSRVMEARIIFRKPSGGEREIFCLEPHTAYPDIGRALAQTGQVTWMCLIGGASKWKHGQVLQ